MTQGARPNLFFEHGPPGPVFRYLTLPGMVPVARSLKLPRGFHRHTTATLHAFHNNDPKHQSYRIEQFH